MRASIRLNNDLTIEQYVALARAAEAAGFDQLWISNDLFWRSGPVLLAAVAQATSRIEIGSGILNPHTIHPAELAMFAATMDELTGSRFNLGLGAGAADFLGWVGIHDPHPATTMRATIAALRALLAGQPMPSASPSPDRASATASRDRPSAAYLRFTPRRPTPIYLGAMGPAMLRLAGAVADGVLPLLFPPEHYFTVRPLVEEGLASRGAPPRDFDLAACFWVSLADDPAAARRALAEKVAYYGHALSPLILNALGLTRDAFASIERAVTIDRDMDRACRLVTEPMLRIGVYGGPEMIVDRLRPLVGAGVRHLSFGPPLGPDPVRAVTLLGREVLPRLRV
jgi:5,10-methylenetetrahydromethanopterin reductase